jgi:hypothetical protein
MGCAGHSTWMLTRRTLSQPNQSQRRELQLTGSPWDVAIVPTRNLRDVFGSGVCYLRSYKDSTWRSWYHLWFPCKLVVAILTDRGFLLIAWSVAAAILES